MPVLDNAKLAASSRRATCSISWMSGRVDKTTIVGEVMERKVSTVSMHAGSGGSAAALSKAAEVVRFVVE